MLIIKPNLIWVASHSFIWPNCQNIGLLFVVRFPNSDLWAGMGRKDDGHYCDVLSSGVNVFLVEGS